MVLKSFFSERGGGKALARGRTKILQTQAVPFALPSGNLPRAARKHIAGPVHLQPGDALLARAHLVSATSMSLLARKT